MSDRLEDIDSYGQKLTEEYCTECGIVLDKLSECCGVPIKNGFCSDCLEHAE